VVRSADFYNKIQSTSTRYVGIPRLKLPQIKALAKVQRAMNSAAVARIHGSFDSGALTFSAGNGAQATLQIKTGVYGTFAAVAIYVSKVWNLYKLQIQAVIQPFEFLDQYKLKVHGEERSQYFMYLGGAGGTGKSRVIDAILDMFKVQRYDNELLVTASSGSAAAKINSATVHSTLGISIGDAEVGRDSVRMTSKELNRQMGCQKSFSKMPVCGVLVQC
jgi:hypothetical protein